MKIFRYTLEEERPLIIPISDTHIGDELFDKASLLHYLEKADYLILNGDIMNTATRNSVSFQYGSNPQKDLDEAVKIFAPYAHKILSVTEGNHEHRVAKEVGLSLTQLFCHQLGILDKYAGIASYLFLNVGGSKVNYKIFHTHGYGGGRSVGAKSNKLTELDGSIDADIYIISHTHQPQHFPQGYRRPNMRKYTVQTVTRWYINSGAFLHYGGYGERFNFRPAPIITPYFYLHGNKHKSKMVMEEI